MENKRQTRSERRRANAQSLRLQQGALAIIVLVILALILFNLPRGGSSALPLQLSDAPVVTTNSGLRIQDEVPGSGAEAQAGNLVSVHYTGYLADGTMFQSSLEAGTPFEFVLGTGSVIAGWDEGLLGMRVGGTRILTIPPELGYGPGGSGLIPPNATLIFQIQLLDVQ